jgi:hypothetical protein
LQDVRDENEIQDNLIDMSDLSILEFSATLDGATDES